MSGNASSSSRLDAFAYAGAAIVACVSGVYVFRNAMVNLNQFWYMDSSHVYWTTLGVDWEVLSGIFLSFACFVLGVGMAVNVYLYAKEWYSDAQRERLMDVVEGVAWSLAALLLLMTAIINFRDRYDTAGWIFLVIFAVAVGFAVFNLRHKSEDPGAATATA